VFLPSPRRPVNTTADVLIAGSVLPRVAATTLLILGTALAAQGSVTWHGPRHDL